MEGIQRTTYTTQMAKDYLGISYWLLLKMVKEKKIPHIRAGNLILFRKAALDNWLTEQEAASINQDRQLENQYGKIRRIQE